MIGWGKVWTVAVTEFLQAVRSKAFLIGVALLPTIGIISALVPKFVGDEVDKQERKVAVVDASGRLYPMLSAIFDGYNATRLGAGGVITGPRFLLERAQLPAGGSADDLRVGLSDRIRRKE